jgi:hypothetical protein
LDAGYCAQSPVSFGLNAGGAGAGPGRLPSSSSRPCGLALRSRRPTLSHLAGVGGLPSCHGPWAVCRGRSPSRRIKPGPSVAAVAIGAQREAGPGRRGSRGLPARHVFSLTWPASAVSHLPMAMDVQLGTLAGVLDQTRLHRRCRCHRRAAGGQAWAGTVSGWQSRRVVFLEGLVPWH